MCPNYLDYDLAVLQSNISACHLKLQEWKDAITAATTALDKLDKVDRELVAAEEAEATQKQAEENVDEEIVSSGAAHAGPAMPVDGHEEDPAVTARRKKKADAARIRYKALMRRARARSEAGGWSNLAGAEEDYKRLATMDNVTPGDRKIVAAQLRTLPARTKDAQAKETAEMWAKLKDVSSIPIPFFTIFLCSLLICLFFFMLSSLARQRNPETVWFEYRKLPDAKGRQDGGLQYELQTELTRRKFTLPTTTPI